MIRKIVISISIIIIVVLLCIFHHDNSKVESKENISYNTNEEIKQVKIIYRGRGIETKDEIIVELISDEVRYTNEKRVYVNEERTPNFYYTYKLDNPKNISRFLKERVLYGNWKWEMISPPEYVKTYPVGEEAGLTFWEIYIYTSENEYCFSHDSKIPIFWYELIELLCEGTGARSEDFGVIIEEETEEVVYDENDEIYGVEIYYRDTPVVKEAKLEIDFVDEKIYYHNLYTGGMATYECQDMNKVIEYFEENVFYDKWNGKLKKAPFTLGRDYDEFGRYIPAWKITIKTSKGNVELWEQWKYPTFWYDMFDVIAESIDVDYEEIGMSD